MVDAAGMRTRLDFSLESSFEGRDEIHFEGVDCAEEIGVDYLPSACMLRCDV